MRGNLFDRSGLRVALKARRQDSRTTNLRLVLQHLFGGAILSRADLARRTELTPATISTLVTELLDTGLVVEAAVPSQEARVGKPPTMLMIKADARAVIGVDLSDPETLRAGVFDLGGTIVDRIEVQRDGRTGNSAMDLIEGLVVRAAAAATSPLLGIGIGTPGRVTTDGAVVEATHFGWNQLNVRDHIETAIGCPTYVSNDANVAALAEYSRGGHQSSHLAAIKIGSGVGAGFVVNGRPLEGKHFGAGEIGHLVVDPSGPLCRCGHRGCLETFVATRRIEAALAVEGADAASVRANAAERLGFALSAVVAILDLDHIVISGPILVLGEDFCEIAAASLRSRCLESVAESVSLSFTALGDDVVMLGASGLVLSQELGVA